MDFVPTDEYGIYWLGAAPCSCRVCNRLRLRGPQREGSDLRSGMLAAVVCLLVLPSVSGFCQSDWPMYGYDESSTRFSPLDQINTKNVQNLTRAWTYHLSVATPASQAAGPAGHGGGRRSSEATPIVIKGVMYLPTPYGTIVALDPETGKELWTYKLDTGRPAQRAVSYWPGDRRTPASILFGTSDGR